MHSEFPVSFRSQRNPGGGTSDARGVNTSKSEFSSIGERLSGRQPEEENGFINEFLVDQVSENNGGIVNRDGLESQTKDSIRLHGSEDDGFDHCFGEDLSDGETSDSENVLGEESSHGARAIGDVDGSSDGLVGGRLGLVVLVVDVTSEISDFALGRRNPEVGRSSVENNHEGLSRSSQSDGSIVLRIHIIVENNWLGASTNNLFVQLAKNRSGDLGTCRVIDTILSHWDFDNCRRGRDHEEKENSKESNKVHAGS